MRGEIGQPKVQGRQLNRYPLLQLSAPPSSQRSAATQSNKKALDQHCPKAIYTIACRCSTWPDDEAWATPLQ